MIEFIIYAVVAIIIAIIGTLVINSNPYQDDDSGYFVALFSILWPIMLILVVGFFVGGLIVIGIEELTEKLKKKQK